MDSWDPALCTGTIASDIAYSDESAIREQIEAAARDSNCEYQSVSTCRVRTFVLGSLTFERGHTAVLSARSLSLE